MISPLAIRTSQTHPLRIDPVQPAGGWAPIGMSLCPGKRQRDALTGQWERDLATDLDRIRSWGAEVVVSLIEAHEFGLLDVAALPEEVERRGMRWLHLPIADRHPPGDLFHSLWLSAGAELVNDLQAGRRVYLHCMGGLGRTGTVAACLLIESGMGAEAAIAAVRQSRNGTIETALQEEYVRQYVRGFAFRRPQHRSQR
ncbi:putative dual specificity protein phosphatase [Azoarcus sp. CIB]|uniref:cyclin-dependent kinase inhibitor 3 family protein n=1 Tax=Aromatoleum sp. (strain CIB) TaxID=198107 RepID=UPI0006A2CE88|nr:cyclin-dependent kinase inhibitor 3 family protein [Azoarcus sp. CIB]AKU11285.1 putative dual specificity protein phosphatase [Azoarcus sp. CIB]